MHKPLIIAHRGASGHAPENTLAAFQLAMDHQADGIELDVMLSKDQQIVVIHDDTVDRTTNGSGRVKELPLEALQVLDAGGGEKIPTLEDVLGTFGGQCLINIELKNYASPFDALPILVAKMVNTFGLTDKVLISSFNPFNFRRFRRHCPGVKLGLLTLPNKANLWVWRWFNYDALHPYYQDVDRDLVSKAKASQQQVNVWTVDSPDEIRRLATLKVDSLITNYPKEAREALEAEA
jgi:glycerophosphoryl diester phosphodiesterase